MCSFPCPILLLFSPLPSRPFCCLLLGLSVPWRCGFRCRESVHADGVHPKRKRSASLARSARNRALQRRAPVRSNWRTSFGNGSEHRRAEQGLEVGGSGGRVGSAACISVPSGRVRVSSGCCRVGSGCYRAGSGLRPEEDWFTVRQMQEWAARQAAISVLTPCQLRRLAQAGRDA